MNRNPDVILFHELLYSRKRLRSRISRHNHANARTFAIFKFGADILVFILAKINGAGCVQLDAGCGVILERFLFLLRISRQMILHIFGIDLADAQILEKSDHSVAGEIPKRIGRNSKLNGTRLPGLLRRRRSRCGTRNSCSGREKRPTLQKMTAR